MLSEPAEVSKFESGILLILSKQITSRLTLLLYLSVHVTSHELSLTRTLFALPAGSTSKKIAQPSPRLALRMTQILQRFLPSSSRRRSRDLRRIAAQTFNAELF